MIYFNAYDAVDVKDSAEYWEVTALPEGCNTPDGYIRVRFEEDGVCLALRPRLAYAPFRRAA